MTYNTTRIQHVLNYKTEALFISVFWSIFRIQMIGENSMFRYVGHFDKVA